MKNKLDLSEKLVCNTVGKMFYKAAEQLNCKDIVFCEKWLVSDLCKRIIEMDETLICQSSVYLLNSFKKEVVSVCFTKKKMNRDAMYWVGYLLTYWLFLEKVSAEYIIKNYDIAAILTNYEVYHTLSIKTAIENIESDCLKNN